MKKNLFSLLLVVSFLFPMTSIQAKADGGNVLKQTTGVVSGVALGPVVGLSRGFVKGWMWGTDATAEALGNKDGAAQKTVGFLTGGVLGAVAGGVSGIVMGAYDGIKYGWDKPWSAENYSWAGKFTDYDPFKW